MPKISIEKEICKGCALCTVSCPQKILEISKTVINAKGYYIAEVVDPSKCTGCTACALMCPDVAITVER
ncbi:MAG: 4Fe-4S binding protein [Clostridia bacterium]|nr:4Fe-4S binding protein [Clostridia bacterium]